MSKTKNEKSRERERVNGGQKLENNCHPELISGSGKFSNKNFFNFVFFFAIILGSFLICGVGKASATTYYVNGSGVQYVGTQGTYEIGSDSTGNGTLATPWATPAKAEATASNSDVVYSAAGTYANRIDSSYGLHLQKTITWRNDGIVIWTSGVSPSAPLINLAVGNATINGITITPGIGNTYNISFENKA